MWVTYLGGLASTSVIVCTILAFLIPFTIYKLNRKLHHFGDPPWKKEEKGVDEST